LAGVSTTNKMPNAYGFPKMSIEQNTKQNRVSTNKMLNAYGFPKWVSNKKPNNRIAYQPPIKLPTAYGFGWILNQKKRVSKMGIEKFMDLANRVTQNFLF
jgi:hypothetical protein